MKTKERFESYVSRDSRKAKLTMNEKMGDRKWDMKKEEAVNEDDNDNDNESMRRVHESSSSIVSREDNRHGKCVSHILSCVIEARV